jgi:hypothetical protein
VVFFGLAGKIEKTKIKKNLLLTDLFSLDKVFSFG